MLALYRLVSIMFCRFFSGDAIYKHYLLPNISLNGTVERKFTKMKFGHLFVFGAVTGNHSKAQTINIVKIYGSLEKKTFGKSPLYCCFKFDNSVKRVTPIVKRLFQVPAGMWSFYLACPILIDSDEASATMSSTENKVPTNVAVTVDDYGCDEDDVTYVQPYRPWKMPGKIAIGSKTSFGTIDPELIIEWMEAYKYIGVDKVVTYIVRTINADALNVLKYYESTGFLDLSFYDLAGEGKLSGAEPESFVRGGHTLTFFLREETIQANTTISGPSSVRQRNVI